MLSNLSFAGDFTITSLSFPNCFRVLIIISKWRMFRHFWGREVGIITIMVINPTSVNQSDCTDHKRFQSYIAEIKVLIFYPLSLRLVKEYQLHLITTIFDTNGRKRSEMKMMHGVNYFPGINVQLCFYEVVLSLTMNTGRS